MRLRKLLLLDLAVLALVILASRLALMLHEFGGHGIAALCFGATSLRAELSPFGGGWIWYRFAPGTLVPPVAQATIAAAGIAVNIATGAIACFVASRMRRPGDLRRLFLHLLGGGSVAQALVYLTMGFYYSAGDPAAIIRPFADPRPFQPLWLLFIPLFAIAVAIAARAWLSFLSAQVPIPTPGAALRWTAATLGVSLAVYVALWSLTWRTGTDHTIPELRIEEEIALETARRRALEGTEKPVVVTPEDVRHRIPLPLAPWALLAAGLLGSAFALRRGVPPSDPVELRPSVTAWLAGSAALAVALISIFFR